LDKTAIASSDSGPAYSPRLAVDGNRVWGAGGGWRDGTPNIFPDWLQVHVGQQTINRIDIYTVRDNYTDVSPVSSDETFTLYGIIDFDVEVWNGTSWTLVSQIRGNNKVYVSVVFPAVNTDKIRIHVLNGASGHSRIVEVEVYNCPGGGGTPTPTATPTLTPTPTPTATPTPTVTPTPTPGECVNVAGEGTASASSASAGGYEPSRANDGSRLWGTTGGWRDGTPGAFPDWLQIDFGTSRTLSKIDLYFVRDEFLDLDPPSESEVTTLYGVIDFDIQYWDGSSWVTLRSVRGNDKLVVKTTFEPVTTTAIRILVLNGQSNHSRIVEVEAFTCN
jgi:hypothetical protein